MVLWAEAFEVVCRHDHQGHPRSKDPMPGGVLNAPLDSKRWRELDRTNRVTLSYWLMRMPAYRAALCLRHELEVPSELLQVALERSPGALDKLVCLAGQQFMNNYETLRGVNSPPFPRVLWEALTGNPMPEMPEENKQMALASSLRWLRRELSL
jgi:hypothetical protein